MNTNLNCFENVCKVQLDIKPPALILNYSA